MGEYAEMMLDGTCCCSCGQFLGDGDGGPACCPGCQPEELKPLKAIKRKVKKTVPCTHAGCAKKFVDAGAMQQHLRYGHGAEGGK